MSKYRLSLFVFFPLLLLVIVVGSLLWVTVVIAAYLVLLGITAFIIQSNFYIKAINRIDTDKKNIVLSFDDGPSIQNTSKILDILKVYNAHAIFFCIGSKIKGNEVLLKRMLEEGHTVANHSFSHSTWFDFFSVKRIKKEIHETNEMLFDSIGLRSKLFRPPYGVVNPMVANAIKAANVTTIGWNKRSFDTVLKNKEEVLNRISNNLKPGDIILLHDTAPGCVELLKDFLELLIAKGYTAERFDKIAQVDCYEK